MKRSLFILCTLLFALGVNMVQAGGGQLERVDLDALEALRYATTEVPMGTQTYDIPEGDVNAIAVNSPSPISYSIPYNISVDYWLNDQNKGNNMFGPLIFQATQVTFRKWRQIEPTPTHTAVPSSPALPTATATVQPVNSPTPTPSSQKRSIFVPLASKPSGPTTFFIAEAMGFCPVLTCSPNQFKQLADGIVTFTWTEARGPCPAWEVKSKVIIDSFDGLTAGRFNGPVAITKVCVATIYW